MTFTIFSIGDSEFLEQVFIALALIGGADDFVVMTKVGIAIGVLSAIFSAIINAGKSIDIHHVFAGLILWSTMFAPTAQVNIEDTYTGDIRIVDNVPIGPAAAGGIITVIGYKLTKLFEVAYNPIVPKLTENEFAESLKIINNIRSISSSSGIWKSLNDDAGGGFVNLRRSWVNYIKDCTLRKIDLRLINADELTTKKYMDALAFPAVLFGTQIYTNPTSFQGQDLTCLDAWTQLNSVTQFNSSSVEAFNALLGFNQSNLNIGESAQSKLQNSLDALLNAGVSAQNFMKLAVLEPVLMNAVEKKYEQIHDISSATMINQAIQQRNTSWAAEQSLFMSIVRPMLAFFESFIYAITPVMAFIIVLGAKGIQLAGKYFMMLIWIQLWMPVLSIINLYIFTAATRDMTAYTLMSNHHWDSFYALSAAADTMQNWIAVGGVLAASTPAIALMLVYGSAVTATHLAGRLKGGDTIDEEYASPKLKDNAALMSAPAMFSGNSVSGVMRTGTEGMLPSVSLGNILSQSTQSSLSRQQTSSDQFSSELANVANQSNSATELMSRASSIGQSVRAGRSNMAQQVLSASKNFSQQYAVDHSHSDAVTGVAGIAASAAAKLDINKAAGYLAGAIGAPKSAITGLLKSVQNSKGDAGSLVQTEGLVSLSGNSQTRTMDQTANKYGYGTSASDSYQYSDQDVAMFNQEISKGINTQDQQSLQTSFGTSETASIKNAASNMRSSSENYQNAKSLNTSLGTVSSLNMRTIGALVSGRDIDGMSGNQESQSVLDQGWSGQPIQVKEQANQLYQRYSQWGMPSDIAFNTARLTALTDSNNFVGNSQAYDSALGLAQGVISQATGLNLNSVGTGFQNNAGLSAPQNTSDLSTNFKSVDEEMSSVTSTVAQKPVIKSLQSEHDDNITSVRQAGESSEQTINSSQQAKYRSVVMNADVPSTSSGLFGALSNTSDWADRRYESVSGGLENYFATTNSEMASSYQQYRELTPEQQQDLQGQIETGNQQAVEDYGFIMGNVSNGFSTASNTMLGAAVKGYDAYQSWKNDGEHDLSATTQAMTLQERGAFFFAAANEASSEGIVSYQNFMVEHGSEFKESIIDIGMQEYGLTNTQANILAEAYDTNPEKMAENISALQKEYAIRDSEGNPMFDVQNQQWKMTEDNAEFTEKMADILINSTDAGDRQASYLSTIAGYNLAKEKQTQN